MDISLSRESLVKYQRDMEEVERIKARELVGMTDAEAWRQIQLLCACEQPWRENREWSGLVEQQALFHRRTKP